jgi:hypothetical protein
VRIFYRRVEARHAVDGYKAQAAEPRIRIIPLPFPLGDNGAVDLPELAHIGFETSETLNERFQDIIRGPAPVQRLQIIERRLRRPGMDDAAAGQDGDTAGNAGLLKQENASAGIMRLDRRDGAGVAGSDHNDIERLVE